MMRKPKFYDGYSDATDLSPANDSGESPTGGLLTYADSLSLPRPWDNESPTKVSECWPFQLSQILQPTPSWHWHFGIEGGQTRAFRDLAKAHAVFLSGSPVVGVVAQFGINEATPRHLPKRFPRFIERAIDFLLRRLGAFFRLGSFQPLRRKHYLYRAWGFPWTTPRSFGKFLSQFVEAWAPFKCPILISPILPPGPALLKITGHGRIRLEAFNAQIEMVCDRYENAFMMTFEIDLVSDGYHLTPAGHSTFAHAMGAELTRRRCQT